MSTRGGVIVLDPLAVTALVLVSVLVTDGRLDVQCPAPGAREAHPLGGAPRWGVSSLDWRSHAVDEDADHPYGVYVARCRQRLFMGTSLYDEAPGWMCVSCLRWTGQPRPEREEGGAG